MTDRDVALENPFKDDQPQGWIQWKGTNVCADFHCKCGADFHIDSDFAYMVGCRVCSTVYAVNGYIKLHEIDQYNPENVKYDDVWEEEDK